jgi:translation initiation factor IF-2
MQTVASVAERLDMSPEEAVEKLNYMLFDVSGVNSEITDEHCDVLFEVDDDASYADKIRDKKLEEKEKEEKKKEAAAKKKAVAAKKKAAAAAKKKKAAAAKKKAPAKKKAAAKSTPKVEKEELPTTAAIVEDGPPSSAAEILPDEDSDQPQLAEILPDIIEEEESDGTKKKPKKKSKADESSEPAIVIGSAIEHEEHEAEIVLSDGTIADVHEVDISAEAVPEEELGPLAEAEKKQEEEEKHRRAAPKPQSVPTPDPKVVAEVIRKASQSKERTKSKRGKVSETTTLLGVQAKETATPVKTASSRKTGKTARKRQKKMERKKRDDELKRSAAATLKEYQAGALGANPKKKKKKKTTGGEMGDEEIQETKIIEVEDSLTVEELAEAMQIDPTDIILELMELNILATKNQSLNMEMIRKIAEPQDFEVRAIIPEEEVVMHEDEDPPESLIPRAPVVTVMGHVDHGKTSFLDQIRKASVADGEAGGITQHIAAYEVNLDQGNVVFLDTPGHEAFTAMRARGAKVTDIVVLVVAADDGIMPQTIEAIDHAKAAEVPIVVAVNKCDKDGAQPDKIRQELTQYDLLDEQWGGKTIMRNISALTGEGIEELIELLVLETELLELKANPDKKGRGSVVESEITRGQGPVAWVLVQTGTIKVGDIFLCGETHGRIRAMHDSHGKSILEAGPSTAVVVQGFNAPASAGDQFVTVKDERIARSIAEQRQHQKKIKTGAPTEMVTLEDFHSLLIAGKQSELKVVVKGDVQGSVDVLQSTLPGLGNEEVRVQIVHSGVGAVNESDVLLASASSAVILGFNIEPTAKADQLAQNEGVDIRSYKVIYEMVDDLKKSLEGMLVPDEKEVVSGHAEIRQVFKSSALGSIAGCMQIDGETNRNSLARLLRSDEVVWEGKIETLRREKEQVAKVSQGFECGIKLTGFDLIQEGDIIEAYAIEQVAKTLA